MKVLAQDTADQVREAVADAMLYWPNAHLGDYTRREDMHSAFGIIRRRVQSGQHIQAAVAYVANDALRHADM